MFYLNIGHQVWHGITPPLMGWLANCKKWVMGGIAFGTNYAYFFLLVKENKILHFLQEFSCEG